MSQPEIPPDVLAAVTALDYAHMWHENAEHEARHAQCCVLRAKQNLSNAKGVLLARFRKAGIQPGTVIHLSHGQWAWMLTDDNKIVRCQVANQEHTP